MTNDMRHQTHDMWGEVNLPSKVQLPTSYGLGMKVCCEYFHKGSVSDLMNDKGVCRKAPATPGLVKNNMRI